MLCTSSANALTQVGGINIFKDVNILASHLHGFYGNPGTDNVACGPMPTDGFPCYRGDNIFADMAPGQCTWYQYDFSSVGSPGVMWYVFAWQSQSSLAHVHMYCHAIAALFVCALLYAHCIANAQHAKHFKACG